MLPVLTQLSKPGPACRVALRQLRAPLATLRTGRWLLGLPVLTQLSCCLQSGAALAQGAFGDSENPKVAEMRERMRTRLAAQEEAERSAKQATVEKAATFLEKFYEVGPSPPGRLYVCHWGASSLRTLHSQCPRHDQAGHSVERRLPS